MKTVKLTNGHEICEQVYMDRVSYLWNQLAADGNEVHMAGKGDTHDIVLKVTDYQPKDNFRKALAMGRYKMELVREDNRHTLKLNIL